MLGFHGLGWWAAHAAMDLDTIALLAIALVYVVLVLLIHLIVDLFRVAVDPRLRAA